MLVMSKEMEKMVLCYLGVSCLLKCQAVLRCYKCLSPLSLLESTFVTYETTWSQTHMCLTVKIPAGQNAENSAQKSNATP